MAAKFDLTDDTVVVIIGSGAGGGTRITKNRRSDHPRCDLLEPFEPFCTQAVFEIRQPSSVTAWTRKAIGETTSDWVNDLHEYDRHDARCL